jgi:hypothetical protein
MYFKNLAALALTVGGTLTTGVGFGSTAFLGIEYLSMPAEAKVAKYDTNNSRNQYFTNEIRVVQICENALPWCAAGTLVAGAATAGSVLIVSRKTD